MAGHNEFLGQGWSFPPTFDDSGQINMVSNEHDIQESLSILLGTTPGERVMLPEYGCNIKSLVFSEINITTITQMKTMINRAILFFEPRITVDVIDISMQEIQNGKLIINIIYTVITTNTRSNMVYPFYMAEGTLIDSK